MGNDVDPPAQDHPHSRLLRSVLRAAGAFGFKAVGALRRKGAGLRAGRVWLLAIAHALLFAAVYWLAFLLRFDFQVPPRDLGIYLQSLPWLLSVKLAVFYLTGHFHGWWRYVTFADLVALIRATVLSLLAMAAINFFGLFGLTLRVPRSILILDALVGLVVLGSLRSSWRIFREHFWPVIKARKYRNALLVGTDEASAILAHQMQALTQLPCRILGLLATNGDEKRGQLGRIPVLGHMEEVEKIAAACNATDVFVVAGALPGAQLRRLMTICREADLNLKIVPDYHARLHGDRHVPIRNIEINDLLGREPVRLDCREIAGLLEGRSAMVTGAGGSIGSEICRQAILFGPRELVLVGRGENRIFDVERELRSAARPTTLHAYIADVTDEVRMRCLFARHRPEVVFHAAAHKHVPLMEANVAEAVRNNVLGTKRLADLAHQFGVKSFVFISTDKAVHPSSVMGATKQLAERYVHALAQQSPTRFSAVRFGNVLGSAGSVVPLFQDQIRRGGPITVTDPRMTRFFMTIPEASQLVLQAAAMGRGGEIFVLEMGLPIRIVDLAADLIRLSGLPEEAIEIVYTGLRPGEKLYEQLYFEDEATLPTAHEKVRVAYHRPYAVEEVDRAIGELLELAGQSDDVIRRKLQEVIPEYRCPAAANGQPDDADPPRRPVAEPHGAA